MADRVAAGQSAEALLDQVAGSGATSAGVQGPIQRFTIKQNERSGDRHRDRLGSVRRGGARATVQDPKAYFIIEGTAGKYIAKYSHVEGEQEVLFKDNSVFQVNRIVNEGGKGTTFFVYISQVTAAPGQAPIKNPFSGTTY